MYKKYLALLAVLSFALLAGIASASEETVVVTKVNTTIQFSASTFLPNINVVNVSWDFGDDILGSGLTVSHSFDSDGVYNVAVNATDNQSDTYYATQRVMVGGWIPYYSNQAYLTLYLDDFPDGVYNMTIGQDNASVFPTASYYTVDKFFTITLDLPNGTFSAELIFRYDDTDDNGIVDGTSIDENTLGLYYYNGASWTAVPDQTLNASNNNVIIAVDHFTTFALLAPVPTSTSTTVPPSGGSGGGGGGGGGGGSTGTTKPSANTSTNQTTPQCQPNWSCTDWSACLNGAQKRTCSDANNCGTISSRPMIIRTCIVSNEKVPENTTSQPETFLDMTTNYWLVAISAGVIVALTIILMLRRKAKKGHKGKF